MAAAFLSGEVAQITLNEGAFMIYRENGRRYIPIKFSVRGRDLAGTMNDVQQRLLQSVRLPEGYHYEWAGEYDSLQKEQRRLAIVVPVSLLIIVALLFTAFNSIRDAMLVLGVLPFGIVGGLASLFFTQTPFSISAAVGMASVVGVCTLGAVVMALRVACRAEKTKPAIQRVGIERRRAGRDAPGDDGLRRRGLGPAARRSFLTTRNRRTKRSNRWREWWSAEWFTLPAGNLSSCFRSWRAFFGSAKAMSKGIK